MNMLPDDLWEVINFGTITKLEEGCRIVEYKNKQYKINESTVAYLQEVYLRNDNGR